MKLSHIDNSIAFFSAEFGIDNELPTYSGGLGILAGDLINEAAIQHFPMIGIGILYKGKDFLQHITGQGKAETRDSEFDHDTSFLRPTTVEGNPLLNTLEFENLTVKVKSYHLRMSDSCVQFFLSTDVDGNPPEWISDMNALYTGDAESQMRQQLLLGLGGIKLLNSLAINPRLYHINEGRPEFISWELTKDEMKKSSISCEEAYKNVREKIVYTNHTLVAAGNLNYPKYLVEKWVNMYSKVNGTDPYILYKDGLIDENTFSTTLYALNVSIRQNAVSKVHVKHSKKVWPNYKWISITNGVNMLRWQDSDYRNPSFTDRQLWDLHQIKKRELMETVKKRTGFEYDTNRLVICWARRLAEYKQPTQIFTDITRLKKIISDANRPVQILYAGNSHSGDPNSKSLIEQIIKTFSNELNGYAIFVPNYNISLANHMTSGSDVWLNTPQGNLEACGTSGMKAIANGVLNCTVLDGWTYEVDWEGIGWVLDPSNISENFYSLLEKEIIPLFYERNQEGIPENWINRMRKSILTAEDFSTEKVLESYKRKLYLI